ncbi:MAG: protein kinase [Myxococcota bacterium]
MRPSVASGRPRAELGGLRLSMDDPPTLEEPAPTTLQTDLETRRAQGELPERIGRYHIKSALAMVRGMWVLTGWDPNLSRSVRIHLLDPRRGWDPHLESEQRVARFKAAARRWAALRHPSMPTLLDAGRDNRLYFHVYENPPGTPLTELLAARTPWRSRLRAVFIQVAEGLQYLHSRGLVLGHVRAASIVVGQPGIHFVDLAHLGETAETSAPPRPLMVQAPENLSGGVYDHRSEQFALGALLYQLLVGHRPFDGVDDQALAAAIRQRGLRTPEDRLADVDAKLSKICMRMLSAAPEDRFANLGAVMAALRDTGEGSPAGITSVDGARSVVMIEPDIPANTVTETLARAGVSAAVFPTWAEAERHLEGLQPNRLVISSAAGTLHPPALANVELRTVPPASARLLGPALATDGLIERLAALAGRTLGLGAPPAGPPEGWACRIARQMCLQLGLDAETASRVAVAMAFRQLQHRLRLSANDLSDLVPVEARRLFRFRPQPGMPGPPEAQTLWAVETFFNEVYARSGAGRRPVKVLQTMRGWVGTELDVTVMEALVSQLRELYPELDLPAVGSVVPRVLLAGLKARPGLVDALEREGFDVVTASDGHEAWAQLRAKPYRAAVVVDGLDGRDGASLLKLTRNHPETRSTAILVLTDQPSSTLLEAVHALPPAELMRQDSPLEALRVRIVRLVMGA